MAYVRLDDQIAQHPKILHAGAEAAWLWACAIAFCNRQLTDGIVPVAALRTMGTFKTAPVKLADRLVAVGLFEVVPGGYRIVYDEGLCETPAQRAKRSDRAARHVYQQHVSDAVRVRDGDHCRYCNRPVTWGGRGADGGTFDHIEPSGPATVDNLVVACRGCNSSKHARTPQQAGMTLRAPWGVH